MERNYNNSKFRSVAAIFGSFLIQLTFGSAYTAENFTELILKKEFKTAQFIFCLAMFGLSASMSFGGFIEKKLNRSKTIVLGSVIMSYAVFLSGIFLQSGKNTNYLTVTYGLFCGLGAGLTYAITLGVPSQWSESSKGLIIGIILSGFALGPLFYQAISKIFPNPNYTILILSGNYIVIQIIGIILIKKSKSPANPESSSCQQSISSNIDVASHKLFFEFDFWIIWLNLALNSVGIILFLQLYPIIFVFNNEFQNNSTIYVVSLTNAFGRIYWGYFSDKIPKQFGLILLNFGSIFMYLFLLLIFKYYETRKDQLFDYATFNFIIGIYCAWVSGNFSLTPALMADRFGEKYFPTNYGYVFTSYTVAGIITSALVIEMAKHIDRTLCILILISLLSLLLSILLKLYPGRSITWGDIEKLFCCC